MYKWCPLDCDKQTNDKSGSAVGATRGEEGGGGGGLTVRRHGTQKETTRRDAQKRGGKGKEREGVFERVGRYEAMVSQSSFLSHVLQQE